MSVHKELVTDIAFVGVHKWTIPHFVTCNLFLNMTIAAKAYAITLEFHTDRTAELPSVC